MSSESKESQSNRTQEETELFGCFRSYSHEGPARACPGKGKCLFNAPPCQRAGTAGAVSLNDTLQPILGACFKRAASWRVPQNWSSFDWFEEVRLEGFRAAWQAVLDFDSARGVSFEAFIYWRVMSSIRSRYRREWLYGSRYVAFDREGEESSSAHSRSGMELFSNPAFSDFEALFSEISLQEAIGTLSPAHQFVIEGIFWTGCTESELGMILGISQRAVSKRKQVALELLKEKLIS